MLHLVNFGQLYTEPSRNGLNKPKAVRGSGYKMLNMGEIFAHGRINTIPMERVQLSELESATSLLQKGDLLFARQSLVLSGAGKCSLFLGYSEPVCFESHIIRVRIDHQKANPAYLYYFYQSPLGRAAVESIVEQGAGASGVRGSDLAKLKFPIPELSIQNSIASILGALDDQIELDRRLNETLEAMARAIFRDWFVDFGPTRAKIEGRVPYLAPEIWALFPNRLDGEGKPGGWPTEPLLDHGHLISGGTPKTDNPRYWNGSVLWASAKDVSQCRSAFLTSTERMITQLGVSESATRVVPKLSTVVMARGATTGHFCMVEREMAINQTCYALSSPQGNPFWLNCAFASLVEGLVHAAHGSVFDTITTRTLNGAKLVAAGKDVLRRFEGIVEPFFLRLLANIEQSDALSNMRDLLLPKLMSGEIRLRDAEKSVGAIA